MAEITAEELLQVYRAHLGAGQVPDRIAEEWLKRAESWDTALDAARAYEEQARWRVLPVSPQEFIESPRYLNLKDEVWPAIMDCLVEAVTGGYLEVIATGAIGWGKSFLADLLEAYTLYELTCMVSPQITLGLATGTAAVIVLQSITERLAQRVLFSPLRALVRQSPWFRQIGLDLRLRTQLVLPGPVRVTPVAGHEQAAIGENVVGAVLDEAGFMAVVEKSKRTRGVDEVYDVAMRNYQALQRRMKSRFLNRGRLPCRLIVVSQVRYVDDFTDRKIQEAKDDPSILVLCKSTWETKPVSRFLGPKFRVAVGTALKRARVLAESEQVPEGQRVIEAPIEFAADFTKDPDGACRDIAGIATSAITPFITRRELIAQAIDPKRKHPFDRLVTTLRDGLQIVPGRLDTQVHAPRAVHLDLAVSGDAAGLGMVYCAGLKRVTRTSFEVSQAEGTGRALVEEPENGHRVYAEYLPVFVVEAVLRIVPPPGDEITLTDVMDLVLRLREFVPITYLSADQFQSVSARQTARERGMIAGEVSVDRTPKPYLDLRDALYDGRLRLYDYAPLIGELLALERSERTGKCDHPAWMRDTEGKRVKGSKDVCIAGETMISVFSGMDIRVDALTDGPAVPVYGYDLVAKRVVAAWATARKTSNSAALLRVTLDNGASVRCTPDHRWLMRDGRYVAASDLRPGDRLMPLYRQVKRPPSSPREMVQHPDVGREWSHWLAYRLKEPGWKPQRGHVIHHLDENQWNNWPDNLRDVTSAEHARLHGVFARRNPFFSRETMKKLHKRPDFAAALRLRAAELGRRTGPENLTAYNKSPERIAELRRRGFFKAHGKLVWSDPEIRARIIAGIKRAYADPVRHRQRAEIGRKHLATLLKVNVSCLDCHRLFTGLGTFSSHLRMHQNHRVVSVEEAGVGPVFDLTVLGVGNFAVGAGVFLHNCDSAAGAIHVLARRPDAWGTQHVDAEPSRVEVGPRGMLRGTVTLGG